MRASRRGIAFAFPLLLLSSSFLPPFLHSSPDNPLWETSPSDSPRTSAAASRPPPGCRRAARTEIHEGRTKPTLGCDLILNWDRREGVFEWGSVVVWRREVGRSSMFGSDRVLLRTRIKTYSFLLNSSIRLYNMWWALL